MSKCSIPGCDGDVIQVFKSGGRTVNLPSPYDILAVSKFKKTHGNKTLTSVCYCNRCKVMYHSPPKDLNEQQSISFNLKPTD